MILYYIIVLLVVLLALIIKYNGSTKKWTFLDILILLILIIFAGSRYYVGTDYGTYYYLYNTYISKTFSLKDFYSTNQEFGFYLLSWITKNISSSPYGIFWTSAIVTYIPIYSRIKKESINFVYTLLMFFLLGIYTGPFNGMRQGIAIAINFYSLQYIEKNRKKFILLNIFGTLFHFTCIIAMLIQLLAKKIKPTFSFLVFTILLGVIGIIMFDKLAFISGLFVKFNPRYISYFKPRFAGPGLKLLTLLRLFIIVYFLLFSKKSEFQYEKTLLIISLFFMMLGFVNVFIARFERYFSICLILVLPNTLSQMKLQDRWLYQYFFTILFFIIFTLSLIYYSDLIPYRSYLM